MTADQTIYDLRAGKFRGKPCEENNFFMGVMNTKVGNERRAEAAGAIAHSINCHDELVEALELAFNGAEFLTSSEMEEIKKVLAKAMGHE